jgi:hypothetical protein
MSPYPKFDPAGGISLTTYYRRKRAAGCTNPHPWRAFDESFFFSWSDDLGWLLGLIWSDGCLKRRGNTVEICSKDRDLLETVGRLISMTGGVKPKNHGRAWRIHFSSRAVIEHLRTVGLHEAKSFTIGWPVMPPEYQGAFVRGLLDGDGTMNRTQYRRGQQVPDLRVSLCTASEALRDGAHGWYSSRGVRSTVNRSGPRKWAVDVGRQDSLRKLHSILYPTSDVPCLLRKRQEFDAWIDTPRARAGRPTTRPQTLLCLQCGQPFQRDPAHHWRKTCSRECVSKIRSEGMRERRAKMIAGQT